MKIKILFVDLFCGAGGTSSGIHMAEWLEMKIAEVVACVNHDANAIKSHAANFEYTKHFTEDIRTVGMEPIVSSINERKAFWEAQGYTVYVCLWASLECTNFSKAKGGQARDADSRTLAEHLFRYLQAFNYDYIWIENVEEFMSWGPLDENGKPESRNAGKDYMKWINDVCDYGYAYEYRILNAADYGAYTSRKRYFGCFAKHGMPLRFPLATHGKNPDNGMFSSLKKWEPVKKCLDFADKGKSIFLDLCIQKSEKHAYNYLTKEPKKKSAKKNKNKPEKAIVVFPSALTNPCFGMEPKLVIKKSQSSEFYSLVEEFKKIHGAITYYRHDPLSPKTHERIYSGLIKYVAGGKKEFIAKYNSYSLTSGYKHSVADVNDPCPVISTQNRLGLITASFIQKYYSGKPDGKVISTDSPAGTITCVDSQSLVQMEFLTKYYSSGGELSSIDEPCGTLSTKDRVSLIQPQYWLDKQFTNKYNHQSIDSAAGAILGNDKHCLMNATSFIDKQFSSGTKHSSVEDPAGALLTVPKMNLVQFKSWVLSTNFNNVGSDIESPAPTITANKKHNYLMNPSWGGNNGDIENPCCTIVARQDKAPLSIVTTESDAIVYAIIVFESDSEILIKIKEFMAIYNITDILMRMLKILELLRIQGFISPTGNEDEYTLVGTQTEKKKYIGNSVVPLQVKALLETMYESLIDHERMAA